MSIRILFVLNNAFVRFLEQVYIYSIGAKMDKTNRHMLLVAFLVGSLILVLAVLAVFTYSPIFTMTFLIACYVIYRYLCTETHQIHRAQEFENRFWTILGFVCSTCACFIPDSPVPIGQWNKSLGFVTVVLCTYGIHSYDRYLHRKNIGRIPHMLSEFPGSGSRQLLDGGPTTVQEKITIIAAALDKIDSAMLPSNFQQLMHGSWRQDLEKLIIDTLADTTTDELNYMLPRIKLGLLMYKIKDYRTMPNRTALLDLLCMTRVVDMNVASRATVLDGMQQMMLTAHHRSELYVRNVILKTNQYDDLSTLKCLTDNKGDFHSMHKLIFQDIQDAKVREDILKHIDKQASYQAAHLRLETSFGKGRSDKPWRKILSDVDDTLTCSGGHFPAGVDFSFPKKQVYPGVLDFYRELDLGVNGPNVWPAGRTGNLVFLSARPHVYKDLSESRTYEKFKTLQREKGLYSFPTLMPGSMKTGKAFMVYNELEPLATKKFQNFLELSQIYPEFKFVFIGDNGQGDVRAAELMCESSAKDKIEAIYMHEVIPLTQTFGYKDRKTLRRWKDMGICFFKDYIAAATDAYQKKLISASGLRHVTEAAANELACVPFKLPILRENKRISINRSIELANQFIQNAGLEPVPYVLGIAVYGDGTQVMTPYGRGCVYRYRPEDGMYEVVLDWSCRREEEYLEYLSSLATSTAGQTVSRMSLFGRSNSITLGTGSPVKDTSALTKTPIKQDVSPEVSPCTLGKASNLTSSPISGETTPETWVEPVTSPGPENKRVNTADHMRMDSTGSISSVITSDCETSTMTVGTEVSARLHDAPCIVTASSIPIVLNNIMEEKKEGNIVTSTKIDQNDLNSNEILPVPLYLQSQLSDYTPELAKSGTLRDDPKFHHTKSLSSDFFKTASLEIERPSINLDSLDLLSSLNHTLPENSKPDEHKCPESSKASNRFIARAYFPLQALKPAPPIGEDINRIRVRLQKEREKEEKKAKENEKRIQKLKAATLFVGSASKKKAGLFGPKSKDPKPKPLPIGSIASTFLGEATVLNYRSETSVYEVSIKNWTLSTGKPVLAYLTEDSVRPIKPIPSNSPSLIGKAGSAILGTINLGMSMLDPRTIKKGKSINEISPIVGEHVMTIFGPAVVTNVRTNSLSLNQQASDQVEGDSNLKTFEKGKYVLFEVTFTEWTLTRTNKVIAILNRSSIWTRKSHSADSKHAVTMKSTGGTVRRVLYSLSGMIGSKEKNNIQPIKPIHFDQNYPVGSLVRTDIGLGLIKSFRSSDGIYMISLIRWQLGCGEFATCHLSEASILNPVAVPGWIVVTLFGVGTVEKIREKDGIIVVRSMNLIQYLSHECIIGRAPAQVGDTVSTSFGPGLVVSFANSSRSYSIDLGFGTLYSPEGIAIKSRLSIDDIKKSRDGGIFGGVLKRLGFRFS